MVSPDRQPHPGLYEIKHHMQNAKVTWDGNDPNKFLLENRYFFQSLDHLTGEWELLEDGAFLAKGTIPTLNIPPGTITPLDLPVFIKSRKKSANHEYAINFTFSLKDATPWAPIDIPYKLSLSAEGVGTVPAFIAAIDRKSVV